MFNLKSCIDDFTENLSEEEKHKVNEEGIVNYLPDNILEKIIKNKISFNKFVSDYKLNKHFIDMAIKLCPDRTEDFAIIIKKYSKLLTVEDFKTLFKDSQIPGLWREVINETKYDVSDEVYLYLYKANYIICFRPDKVELVVRDRLKDKKIEDMDFEEMSVLSLLRKLTPYEMEIILEEIFSSDSILKQKAGMEVLAHNQYIPSHVIETIIKTWEFDPYESFYLKLLSTQNLDSVADYMIEKYKFNDEQIKSIKENKVSSKDTIEKLCKNTL